MSIEINTRAGARNDYVRVALDYLQSQIPTSGITAAAAPNASGEAAITHGRATTPTKAWVTLVGDVANVHLDVVSVTATTLTVRFKTATGTDVTTGTYTVHWMVV